MLADALKVNQSLLNLRSVAESYKSLLLGIYHACLGDMPLWIVVHVHPCVLMVTAYQGCTH